MVALLHQRCQNHAAREAAARCPQCMRFFCRECITEHDHKVLCAGCLAASRPAALQENSKAGALGRVTAMALGVSLLWLCFYYFGRLLLSIPSSFHEGTIWMKN